MMGTMNQYHCQKCGMGLDTEEELEQHDYDVHVKPLLLTTLQFARKKGYGEPVRHAKLVQMLQVQNTTVNTFGIEIAPGEICS